nr:MAG TPA: hypothetical protein [Caudoviricetes sp.]
MSSHSINHQKNSQANRAFLLGQRRAENYDA